MGLCMDLVGCLLIWCIHKTECRSALSIVPIRQKLHSVFVLDFQVLDVQFGNFLRRKFDHIVTVEENWHLQRNSRRQPPESRAELQDALVRRFHNVAQRRRHDVSWSGRPESNVPTGWRLETPSFPQCCMRAPPLGRRCSSRGPSRAGFPPFAPASGSRRRRISATLRSGCQEATDALSAGSLPLGPAGLGLTPVPSADHSTPPESCSGRVRSPRRGCVAPPPTSGSGYRTPPRPRPGGDTADLDSAIPARTPPPWEKSWTGARRRRLRRCR